jgi:hypothetical protein
MNYEIKKEMDEILALHIQEENLKFEQLFTDIKELRREMAAFTEAWQQARGVVTFIKWMVSIAGGITAFLLFIRDHIK